MKIFFINNKGGGFADHVEIPQATTVSDFFQQRIGGEPDNWLIRVNRQHVPSDYVLQEGDRVSITPVRIEGAA
jgi:sulfur carrier protein ThiS